MTTTLFTTPEDAEDAFYEALGRADLDALIFEATAATNPATRRSRCMPARCGSA